MDIKIVSRTPTDLEKLEAKVDESLPQQTLEGGDPTELHRVAVKQVLDIDGFDKSYDDELETLIKWARTKTEDDDPIQMKWVIRDLQMRLGTPAFGDPIKNLARFAYLDLEEKRIKAEKRDFL